jgi:hypothetical protein
VEATAPRHGWIHKPALDLLVGCGGWSLPLLLLAYPFADGGLPAWTAAFYALALVFNYPHYMATIYRAYHSKSDFDRYRFYTKHCTAILLLILLAAHGSYRLLPWLFTIYITWSPWHYMGQNLGLLLMFARRNGVTIDKKDRNALWTAFVASYAMIFLSFHTNPSSDPYVISLGIPTLVDLFRIPLLAIFLVLGSWPLFKLVRRAGWRPMLAPITLYVTEFLWFVLPTVVELVSNVRLPQTSYSAGILALMHSAQYIWITSYYARSEAEADRRTTWKPAVYFGGLFLGGIALFVPAPWIASWALGRDFTSSFLIVTALVNIHHFILDGAVWKLRDQRVASVLTPDSGADKRQYSKPWSKTGFSGWAGLAGRPVVKWSAVAVLVLLAGLDQARYFLALGKDQSKLETAASLDPFDAPLQARLAQAYVLSGDYARAERTLKLAARQNPEYPLTHLYLGNVVELQGGTDALSHYRNCQQTAQTTGNTNIEKLCSIKIEEMVRQ